MEEENERLKRIIARQALEIEVKSELLKKNSYTTQEKVMLTKRFSDRAPIQLLSRWLQLPRSTFYYKPPGHRGRKPSTHTLYQGAPVTNEEVVDKIKTLISVRLDDR